MWISDTLRTAGGQLVGRAPYGYECYVYRLPLSKVEITISPRECWNAGNKEGRGSESLWNFIQPLETPLKLAAEQREIKRRETTYQRWITRLTSLAQHIAEDYASGGMTVSSELRTIDSSLLVFKSVEILIDGHRELWANFNSEGDLDSAAISGKSFTGLPSFKKVIKPYWPNFITK